MIPDADPPGPTVAPPGAGEYREVTGGILWIRLPVPGGLGHINVWLVPARRGWFLVDTGVRTEAVEAAWQALHRRLPLGAQLQEIVVTHHHPDHYGMAGRLSDRYGVPVRMTGPARQAAQPRESSGNDGRVTEFADEFGLLLDEDMRAILRGGAYRSLISGNPPIEPLTAGDTLPGAKGPWRISVHDGHAAGHACLYQESTGVLLSGDQVLPVISSNISLHPGNRDADPLGEYLASLDELDRLPADTLVLPAHGRPFATLHQRTGALRRQHADRLGQLAAACDEPATTGALMERLFDLGRLDALNRLLATTETLAHLRRLEQSGDVERQGTGARLRWQARAGSTARAESVSSGDNDAGHGVG